MIHTMRIHFVQLSSISFELLHVLLLLPQYPTGISRWRESDLLIFHLSSIGEQGDHPLALFEMSELHQLGLQDQLSN